MKIPSSLILSFTLIVLWSCSDSGEPIIGGCIFETDICGTCGGTIESLEDCCPEGQVSDCAGECGGSAVEDECGQCDGDNSSCVNYSTEIQPIFDSKCTSCHGSSGGLNLGSYSTLMSGTSDHGPVVIPGDSENSIIIQKLSDEPPFVDQMPKGGTPLDDTIIDLIQTWIDEGALDN